ncbi:hypothetical protein [Paramagnetospirillum magneticum]|uniref:Uncharacterized protein n=1 Tax=Paramagnetospirillum magneticum (strain ATCC 700264 / AMB-1) TaxID=342108 RepID=Q2WA52_PARM1|nr:hypothetical protein [Paramagnetospirillum magneticum]BAE49273.1 hypothetical protein amb0469 [Paramagnetospirillum magneticum AMB-1]
MNALSFIEQLLTLIPLAVSVGENVADLVDRGKAVIATADDPTADDWAFLHQLEAKLAAQIDTAAAATVSGHG